MKNMGNGGTICTSVHPIVPSLSWICELVRCLGEIAVFLRHMWLFVLNIIYKRSKNAA